MSMDLGLFTYSFVAVAACWAAIFTVSGPLAKLVLTGGLYRYHPDYRPPLRPRLLRGHADHRPRAVEMSSFADLLGAPAPACADDTVVLVITGGGNRPTVVDGEMADDGSDTGAEHWGGLLAGIRDEMIADGSTLLADMSTAEREIYNLDMVLLHEEAMTVQRTAETALDGVVAAFEARLDALLERHLEEHDRIVASVIERHGNWARWRTGQFARLDRELATT